MAYKIRDENKFISRNNYHNIIKLSQTSRIIKTLEQNKFYTL